MERCLRYIAALAGALVICVPVKAESYIADEYQEICMAAGQEYNIKPELLMALIERESSGIADAVSESGCVGLCQLSKEYFEGDLMDPETNIYLAAEYMRELLDRYRFVALALMKYHGESGAVEKFNTGKVSNYAKGIYKRSLEIGIQMR